MSFESGSLTSIRAPRPPCTCCGCGADAQADRVDCSGFKWPEQISLRLSGLEFTGGCLTTGGDPVLVELLDWWKAFTLTAHPDLLPENGPDLCLSLTVPASGTYVFESARIAQVIQAAGASCEDPEHTQNNSALRLIAELVVEHTATTSLLRVAVGQVGALSVKAAADDNIFYAEFDKPSCGRFAPDSNLPVISAANETDADAGYALRDPDGSPLSGFYDDLNRRMGGGLAQIRPCCESRIKGADDDELRDEVVSCCGGLESTAAGLESEECTAAELTVTFDLWIPCEAGGDEKPVTMAGVLTLDRVYDEVDGGGGAGAKVGCYYGGVLNPPAGFPTQPDLEKIVKLYNDGCDEPPHAGTQTSDLPVVVGITDTEISVDVTFFDVIRLRAGLCSDLIVIDVEDLEGGEWEDDGWMGTIEISKGPCIEVEE